MDRLRVRFGNRLKDLRKSANLTQAELAEKAEISVDFVGLVERGLRAPSFESIEKIASVLNVPIKQLFNFSEK
jgi:transcriptional regulator with XRE-family HTH domain